MTRSQKYFARWFLMFFTAAAAQAGLLLSGNTEAFFEPVSSAYATVTNRADGSAASFRTGIPVAGSFKSGVKFNGQNFENLENGDTFSLGAITYYNGISQVGTSSGSSLLDLYLNFDDPAVGRVHLATVTFGIDATTNHSGDLAPDAFTAAFQQPASIWVGDELVKFTIDGLPKSVLVAENNSLNLADITVTVLIPESSTVASVLGFATLAFTMYFRRREFGVPV